MTFPADNVVTSGTLILAPIRRRLFVLSDDTAIGGGGIPIASMTGFLSDLLTD